MQDRHVLRRRKPRLDLGHRSYIVNSGLLTTGTESIHLFQLNHQKDRRKGNNTQVSIPNILPSTKLQENQIYLFYFCAFLLGLLMSEESGLHSKRADGAGKLVCRAWLVVQAADQNRILLNCPQIPFLLYFSLLKDTQFRKKEFWYTELA